MEIKCIKYFLLLFALELFLQSSENRQEFISVISFHLLSLLAAIQEFIVKNVGIFLFEC